MKLLGDFEQGKMSRRQLIKSLALTAVAASAAGAVPAAAAVGTGFEAVAVNPIVLDVEDHTKTRDFYVDLLGMTVLKEFPKQSRLQCGKTIFLVRNRTANTPRLDHFGIELKHWDKKAVEAELKRRGIQTKWEGMPPDTPDRTLVIGPDGFQVQISGENYQPLEHDVDVSH